MNAKQFFESRWLSGADLGDKTWSLTIERVDMETVRNKKNQEERKLAVKFTGARKPLLLNKTNGRLLLGALGAETDAWIGAVCTVRPENIEAFGSPTVAVRIQAAKRPDKPPTPAENAKADQAIVAREANW